MYFYINGTRVNTTSDAAFNFTNGGLTKVGCGLSLDISFVGYLYELRIVKGTALYTEETHQIPTESLTAVNNTSLLLNFSKDQFKDSSTNNHPITIDNFVVADQFGNNYTVPNGGDVKPTPHSPFDYQ